MVMVDYDRSAPFSVPFMIRSITAFVYTAMLACSARFSWWWWSRRW